MTDKKDMGPFANLDHDIVDQLSRFGTTPYRGMVKVSVRDIDKYNIDDLPTTIEGWIEWLSSARDEVPAEYKSATKSVLTFEESDYDSGASASFKVWYDRPETDAEMVERVNGGLAYLAEKEREEKATYHALKRKFEHSRQAEKKGSMPAEYLMR